MVENAIKLGIEPRDDGGANPDQVESGKERVYISVPDIGPAMKIERH